MFRAHILVCGGTGCTSGNSMKIYDALVERIRKEGLENEVHVTKTGCFGLCALGPIMIVYPGGAFYSQVKVEDVDEIINEHIIKGRIVTRLLYKETVSEDGGIKALNDTNFYKKQHRVALRNCGVIDPENIDEYIAFDGYKALEQRAWVKVTAKVGYKFHNIYRGKGPVLTALSVEPAEKPLNDVVTFS